MIKHGLWRKKAARCIALMLAASLVFPGTVHTAFAMDAAPNEQAYGEYQDPLDGIPDEYEAMDAVSTGQDDVFGLLTDCVARYLGNRKGKKQYLKTQTANNIRNKNSKEENE